MANANDTFTAADTTLIQSRATDSGHNWLRGFNNTADMDIFSNQCKTVTSGTYPLYYCDAVPATEEYDVQADLTAPTTTGEVNGRQSTSATTRYRVQYISSEWRLAKVVAGTVTTLATYVGDVPTSVRTVKLEIRNAAKKLFIDGVERASSADNAITAAGHGGIRSSGLTDDRIDNWSLTDVSVAVADAVIHQAIYRGRELR